MSDTSPHASESAMLERIRQLEMERDDYKAYTIATMNGWRFWQETDGLWFGKLKRRRDAIGPHPTWYLAARAAMKEVRDGYHAQAVEYLDGGGE